MTIGLTTRLVERREEMAAAASAELPGTHAPHHGGPGIFVLALAVPVLLSMVLLAIAPGLLDMARIFGTRETQLIQTLPALLMIAGAASAGFIAERLGRRVTLILFLLAYALGGGLGYFAGSVVPILAGRAALGFAAGVLMTTTYAVVGEYYEGPRREKILGYMTTTGSLAAVGMLTFGGLLVETHGWRAPFLLYFAGAALVPLAATALTRAKTMRERERLSWVPVLTLWPLYMLLTAYMVGVFMMAIQGAFLLQAHGITAPSIIGMLLSVSSIFGALGGFCYGFMRRWLNFRGMFVWISVAMGAGFLLAVWAPSAGWFVFAALITGLGIGLVGATITSEILLRVPDSLHDRALGLNTAALFFGPFLNPWVVAPLAAWKGIFFAITVIGFGYLVAGAGFFVVRKHRASGVMPM
jgi:MFS family permease